MLDWEETETREETKRLDARDARILVPLAVILFVVAIVVLILDLA